VSETLLHAPLHNNARPKSLLHPKVLFPSNESCKVSRNNRLGPIVGATNRRVENSANEDTCQNGSRSAGSPPRNRNERSQLWQSRGLSEGGDRRNATNEVSLETKIPGFVHPKSGRSQCLAAWNCRLNEESIRAGRGQRRGRRPLAAASWPAQVVRMADFTGNGVADLAVLTADGVSIYRESECSRKIARSTKEWHLTRVAGCFRPL
jgi:hypothetical protein